MKPTTAPASVHRGERRITAVASPASASSSSPSSAAPRGGSHPRQRRDMSIAASPQWDRYVESRLQQFASGR